MTSVTEYEYPLPLKVVNLTFLVTGSVIGMLGNSILIGVILKIPKLRSPLNVMVLYIGILDLLHVSVKGFLYGKKIFHGNLGLSPLECNVLICVLFFANLGVSTHITAIAIYRVLKVTGSTLLHEIKFVAGALTVSTIVAAIGIVLVLLYPDSSYSSCLSSTDVLYDKQATTNDLVYPLLYTPVYVILFVTVIGSYTRIVVFTRRHRQQQKARLRRKCRTKVDLATNVSLLLISLDILLAYLPFIILGSIELNDSSSPGSFYWILNLRTFCVTLNMYSSVLNPFVYFFGNRHWRNIVWEELDMVLLPKCFRKKNVTETKVAQGQHSETNRPMAVHDLPVSTEESSIINKTTSTS